MLRDLTHQLLAGARQIAQLLDGRGRHEARSNQPVREQIGAPSRIAHVGLASRHIADVLRIGQHQLEVTFEQVPYRFPIHSRGLHGHVRHSVCAEPLLQLNQRAGGRSKSPGLIGLRLADAAHTCYDAVLVHIEPGTARIQHLHGLPPEQKARREKPSSSNSSIRAPQRSALQATRRGARRISGPTS
jgi:hypothetical protein